MKLDARDMTKGDRPHILFYVIASKPKKNGSLEVLPLRTIEPSFYDYDRTCGIGIDTSEYSFLLPNSEGEFRQDEWTRFEYSVTTLSPAKQLIEVDWDGDDYRGVSRYIAEEDRVEPLYSEQMGAALGILTGPIGLVFSLVLYRLGRSLRKRYRPKHGDNTMRR